MARGDGQGGCACASRGACGAGGRGRTLGTAVNCAGLEPGAQSSAASQLPSERRPRALPPTGADSPLAV